MSLYYERTCRECGRPIRMAEMSNRQWLPIEIDGTGLHQCAEPRTSEHDRQTVPEAAESNWQRRLKATRVAEVSAGLRRNVCR